jgi:hypothetical protein
MESCKPHSHFFLNYSLWQLFTREPVWKEIKNSFEIIDKVCSGGRPKIPETVPITIKELMIDCWAADPVDRPTFKRIHEKLELFQSTWSPEVSKKPAPPSAFEAKIEAFFGNDVKINLFFFF